MVSKVGKGRNNCQRRERSAKEDGGQQRRESPAKERLAMVRLEKGKIGNVGRVWQRKGWQWRDNSG